MTKRIGKGKIQNPWLPTPQPEWRQLPDGGREWGAPTLSIGSFTITPISRKEARARQEENAKQATEETKLRWPVLRAPLSNEYAAGEFIQLAERLEEERVGLSSATEMGNAVGVCVHRATVLLRDALSSGLLPELKRLLDEKRFCFVYPISRWEVIPGRS
jgi:hypothetical protein